jgi:hypothetical protein
MASAEPSPTRDSVKTSVVVILADYNAGLSQPNDYIDPLLKRLKEINHPSQASLHFMCKPSDSNSYSSKSTSDGSGTVPLNVPALPPGSFPSLSWARTMSRLPFKQFLKPLRVRMPSMAMRLQSRYSHVASHLHSRGTYIIIAR